MLYFLSVSKWTAAFQFVACDMLLHPDFLPRFFSPVHRNTLLCGICPDLNCRSVKGCWLRRMHEEEPFLFKMHCKKKKKKSPRFVPWLVGADCEGQWRLIELRICSDLGAASFICLIIVEETRGRGGARRNGPQIALKKLGSGTSCLQYLWRMSQKINSKWSI